MKRVILTTGGTGGHIFPALAVAEALRAHHPFVKILFLGGRYGPESELAQKAGLEFVGLPVRGVLGRGIKKISAGFLMLAGCVKALGVIRRFKPDVVLGLGGYAAFAGVLSAAWKQIPTAIHEQNSIPGMSNRVLSRWVDKVLVSFPDSREGFKNASKIVHTGNPVRTAIQNLRGRARDHESHGARGAHLLVLGGSQGARAVNSAVLEGLDTYRKAGVEMLHQTGILDAERTLKGYQRAGLPTTSVEPFIHDMAGAYHWADLAICRAGATTVAELAVAGKPAVFIPFPYATHNHQVINARFLEKAGAARMIEQKDLDGAGLASLVIDLLNDDKQLETMRNASSDLARPKAAEAVVSVLADLVQEKP